MDAAMIQASTASVVTTAAAGLLMVRIGSATRQVESKHPDYRGEILLDVQSM